MSKFLSDQETYFLSVLDVGLQFRNTRIFLSFFSSVVTQFYPYYNPRHVSISRIYTFKTSFNFLNSSRSFLNLIRNIPLCFHVKMFCTRKRSNFLSFVSLSKFPFLFFIRLKNLCLPSL